MAAWVVVFLVLAGTLFALKLLFVLAAGGMLPFTRGALFVSTAQTRVAAALGAVPMMPGDLLVDLGCGDGRVLRAATKRYGARTVGFEINPVAYLLARLLCLGRRDIQVRWGNFWSRELREADVIFCYLFPDVMPRLAGKLEAELRPGVWVVSCNFPCPGWHAQDILRPRSSRHSDPIYIYRVPDAYTRP